MNGAHIHLLMTHLPVLGTIFGLLLLGFALMRKNVDLAKISLGVFIIAGLFAAAVYLTGEQAEEVVEDLPGVTHALIETHEEAGLYALIVTLALGVVSLFGLLRFMRRPLPAWFTMATLVLALVSSGVVVWTAGLGGKINHPEIRTDQAMVQPGNHARPGGGEAEEHEGDHDRSRP